MPGRRRESRWRNSAWQRCLHGKLAAYYVMLGDKVAARAELDALRRILPDITASQYMAVYPCGYDTFRDALGNSLTELGMPA